MKSAGIMKMERLEWCEPHQEDRLDSIYPVAEGA